MKSSLLLVRAVWARYIAPTILCSLLARRNVIPTRNIKSLRTIAFTNLKV